MISIAAPVIFSLTIAFGAALLFQVQLIFGRLTLPALGGSPAVWSTALVFYQAALLAGYAWAHGLSRRLPPRSQTGIHLAAFLLVFLVLPVGIPAGWEPPVQASPVPWLLALLAVAVGLPVFVLSAGSPLLQMWFLATRGPADRDPCFLYAASNWGSFVGLLAYPFAIGPFLSLRRQSELWAVGYAVLGFMMAGCAAMVWMGTVRTGASGQAPDPIPPPAEGPPPSMVRRLRWLALAFVPSSLLLSVTTYITTDVAPIPFLWVAPMGTYLITIALAFGRRPPSHRKVGSVFPLAVIGLVICIAMGAMRPIPLILVIHLEGFAIIALACHGELARDRPPAGGLTGFYLWMAAGGALGGAFNALIAPLLFSGAPEYGLALLAACLLAGPWPQGAGAAPPRRGYFLPAVVILLAALLPFASGWLGMTGQWRHVVAVIVPALGCLFLAGRPLRFASGLAVVLLAGSLAPGEEGMLLQRDRSFFGVHRVVRDPGDRFNYLIHGCTIHGIQSLDPARRREPLSYFHRDGPFGGIHAALPDGPTAVVGLGTGSIAAYGMPGRSLTFYEIDPAVIRFANDRRFFTYLSDSEANVRIVPGDARRSLELAPDRSYRLLVLDAYSSDSIPLHLLSREAVRLYLQKLAPGGILAFHVSNRNLDLEPVVANLARDAGLVCLSRYDSDLTPEQVASGRVVSRWLAAAREEGDLSSLASDPRWRRPRAGSGAPWTDDFSSVLGAIGYGGR